MSSLHDIIKTADEDKKSKPAFKPEELN